MCHSHFVFPQNVIQQGEETIPKSRLLQLSSANIDRHGVYLMDQGDNMYLFVGGAVSDSFCQEVFNVPNFLSIPEGLVSMSHDRLYYCRVTMKITRLKDIKNKMKTSTLRKYRLG